MTTATRHITSRSEALLAQEDAATHSTMPFRAPELFDVATNTHLDSKVDMWSLGCIIAELFTGQPLFPGESEQELLEYMMELNGIPSREFIDQSRKKDHYFDTDYCPYLIEDPTHGISRIPNTRTLEEAVPCSDFYLLDFLRQCLKMDPAERISAADALQHEFINPTPPKYHR